jgi:nitrite reductase/ring-hydroxylating ferredoxin subunit
VFNVRGQFYALQNVCPHRFGPVCTGHISQRVIADAPPTAGVSGPNFAREQEIIRCPWHLWEFDVTTGRCLVDSEARIRTYPVLVEEGQIVVEYEV